MPVIAKNKKDVGVKFFPQHFLSFLEKKKEPVLKEKTMEVFLVKVFTEGKKVVGEKA